MERRLVGDLAVQDGLDRVNLGGERLERDGKLLADSTLDVDLVLRRSVSRRRPTSLLRGFPGRE